MRAQVKPSEQVFSCVEQNQNLVVGLEVTQEHPPAIGIQSTHRLVVPNLARAERADAGLFEFDFAHRELGHKVAPCATTFDPDVAEIQVELDLFQSGLSAQEDGDHFSLSIGIGCEVQDLGFGRAFRDGILTVSGDGGDVEPLHHASSGRTVEIHDVVCGSFVSLFPDGSVDQVFAKECLARHLAHLHHPILSEHDDVVNV